MNLEARSWALDDDDIDIDSDGSNVSPRDTHVFYLIHLFPLKDELVTNPTKLAYVYSYSHSFCFLIEGGHVEIIWLGRSTINNLF